MEDDDVMAERANLFFENKLTEVETAETLNEAITSSDLEDGFSHRAWKDSMKTSVQSLAEDTKRKILLWNEAESDVQTFLSNEWRHLKTKRERLQKMHKSASSFADELKQEKAVLESRVKNLVKTLQKSISGSQILNVNSQ